MFVAGHLVFALHVMTGGALYLLLALHAQTVAHLAQNRHNDIVEQRVTLNIEVSRLGRDAQGFHILLHLEVLFLIIGEFLL